MKKICALLLLLGVLLSGCMAPRQTQFTLTKLDLFDTVTTVIGTGMTQEAFLEAAQKICEELLFYHRLFDIYNEYDGIANLKTVNDRAGIAPVAVDEAIILLLADCKSYYDLTGGKVNVAMGSVLQLWHEARSNGLADPQNAALPEEAALAAAAQHTAMESLQIDRAAGTVYLADPEASLDVGAIAKGWAVQKVAENAPAGMLISVGGNVCATGAKHPDGTPWVVGIQDPDDPDGYLRTLCITGGAVVTSGDYQRTYTVQGKAYHHIIDPDTRMPAASFRSVTVVCADSAVADMLSTALFLLPLEEGQALAARMGAEALWLSADGNQYMTAGFEALLR